MSRESCAEPAAREEGRPASSPTGEGARLARFLGAAGIVLWHRLPLELAWYVASYVPAPPRARFVCALEACRAGDPHAARLLGGALRSEAFKVRGVSFSAAEHLSADCGRLLRQTLLDGGQRIAKAVFGLSPDVTELRCRTCRQSGLFEMYECPCDQSGVFCLFCAPRVCRDHKKRVACKDGCPLARDHLCECGRDVCRNGDCLCSMLSMWGLAPDVLSADRQAGPQPWSPADEADFG
ncbi:MAG TPA: hypothetical protein VNI01_05190 [Elusimicrobiota bacterium]|nr:hypothetical protein [Elusimicrobiota bacterium]